MPGISRATSEPVCFSVALSAGLLRSPLTAHQGIYDVQFQLSRQQIEPSSRNERQTTELGLLQAPIEDES